MGEQFVCTKCGYNIIGFYPEFCPFCGALKEYFITAEECSQKYKVIESRVNDRVTRLNSYPSLGFEHAAYCIENNGKRVWIDCPSTFSKNLEPMDKIIFTHHHFLGASNLYREYYTAFVWIHKRDSENTLAQRHPFDKKFTENFNLLGIDAYHIDGHTPGFTFYIFDDVLFICDYVFVNNGEFMFNPYGPNNLTIEGAKRLMRIIESHELITVCGFNYVENYEVWIKLLINLLS